MIYFNEKSKKKRKVLYNNVFDEHKKADKFIIITGYTGPQMVNDLGKLPYKDIILVVGMYGRNINFKLHESILKSNKNIKNLTVYYTNKLVHTKLYAWYKKDKLSDLLIGSANFSTTALIENPYKETLYHVKEKGAEQQIKEYIDQIFSDMYLCTDLSLKFKGVNKQELKNYGGISAYKASYSDKVCNLTLLANQSKNVKNLIEIPTVRGQVQAAAGLNWGYTAGNPSIEHAYIQIDESNIEEAPELFPTRPKSEKKPIEAIWDDGTTMLLSLEGNGPEVEDGIFYPKQVSTYKNKSKIGIYLRKRIGDKIGKNLIYSDYAIKKMKEIKKLHAQDKPAMVKAIKGDKKLESELKDKFITLDYLLKYGRTDVSVSLLEDGTYYFDFSIK
jgi:HKD family nuclease